MTENKFWYNRYFQVMRLLRTLVQISAKSSVIRQKRDIEECDLRLVSVNSHRFSPQSHSFE